MENKEIDRKKTLEEAQDIDDNNNHYLLLNCDTKTSLFTAILLTEIMSLIFPLAISPLITGGIAIGIFATSSLAFEKLSKHAQKVQLLKEQQFLHQLSTNVQEMEIDENTLYFGSIIQNVASQKYQNLMDLHDNRCFNINQLLLLINAKYYSKIKPELSLNRTRETVLSEITDNLLESFNDHDEYINSSLKKVLLHFFDKDTSRKIMHDLRSGKISIDGKVKYAVPVHINILNATSTLCDQIEMQKKTNEPKEIESEQLKHGFDVNDINDYSLLLEAITNDINSNMVECDFSFLKDLIVLVIDNYGDSHPNYKDSEKGFVASFMKHSITYAQKLAWSKLGREELLTAFLLWEDLDQDFRHKCAKEIIDMTKDNSIMENNVKKKSL